MAETVGDFFWRRLSDWGVRRVFGYPGDGINGLIGALGRMERAGLVQRSADKRDGRGVIVALTEEGLALADAAMADHAAIERRLVAVLGADDQATMARLLSLLVTAKP